MKNNIIQLATLSCRILKVFYILLMILFISMSFIWLINPSLLEGYVTLVDNDLSFFVIFGEGNATQDFSKIYTYLFLFKTIKATIFTFLVILIISKFQDVLKSITSLESFRKENISNFRNLALFLFICFLIGMIDLSQPNSQLAVTIAIDPEYLLASIASLVISEIFKEANILSETTKYTV